MEKLYFSVFLCSCVSVLEEPSGGGSPSDPRDLPDPHSYQLLLPPHSLTGLRQLLEGSLARLGAFLVKFPTSFVSVGVKS